MAKGVDESVEFVNVLFVNAMAAMFSLAVGRFEQVGSSASSTTSKIWRFETETAEGAIRRPAGRYGASWRAATAAWTNQILTTSSRTFWLRKNVPAAV